MSVTSLTITPKSNGAFSTCTRPASILLISSTSLIRVSRCSPLRLMISMFVAASLATTDPCASGWRSQEWHSVACAVHGSCLLETRSWPGSPLRRIARQYQICGALLNFYFKMILVSPQFFFRTFAVCDVTEHHYRSGGFFLTLLSVYFTNSTGKLVPSLRQ